MESREGTPILVSACLAGCECRFDGSANTQGVIAQLVAEGRAVMVCPEEEGGLGTPRPPAEIVGGDGHDVLAGRARVMTDRGEDVTDAYLRGAEAALEKAHKMGAQTAVLKGRSPSCGKNVIYDGSFSRTRRSGDGVLVALLQQNGIEVMTDEEFRSSQS